MRQTLRLAVKKFMAIDGTQRAAAFAYYAFFSLFPLIVLFVAVGSQFFDREVAKERVIGYVEKYVPLQPEMERQVFDTIDGVIKARGQVGAIAAVVLLWGSLRFFTALVRATNRAWNTDMHNWWQMPLKSLALLGVLAGALGLGIAVPVAARFAREALPSLAGAIRWLSTLAVQVTPVFILFAGIVMFYRLAPRRETHFSQVWPAALGTAVALRGVESLFALYVANFAKFNVVYGAFGGIMALLMWIFLSGSIVVLGACVAAAQAEVKQGS